MGDNKAWKQDQDLDIPRSRTSRGSRAESQLSHKSNIQSGKGVVWVELVCTTAARQPSRRAREIHSLRQEIKMLNKQFKRFPVEEKEGIKDLTNQLRGRLCRLRRTENTRKRRKNRENKRAHFTKDPFRFTRTMLGEAKSGRLARPREDVESLDVVSPRDTTTRRHHVVTSVETRPWMPTQIIDSIDAPGKELNISEQSRKEVQEVVKKPRTGSAPGLSDFFLINFTTYFCCLHCSERKVFRDINSTEVTDSLPCAVLCPKNIYKEIE